MSRIVDAKPRLFRCSLIVSALVASIASASAARIYNFTGQIIYVAPVLGTEGGISIAPGAKSDSINWKSTVDFVIRYPDAEPGARGKAASVMTTVCHFNTGVSADLQGGNYIVITQNGRTVNCSFCNSGKTAFKHDHGTVASHYAFTSSRADSCK